MEKCCFVLFRPHLPRREAESQASRARSHAAIVAHQRRISRNAARSDSEVVETDEWRVIRNAFERGFPTALRNLKGNCDPFDTCAVQITPRINQILIFIRDDAIPAAYFNSMYASLTQGKRRNNLSLLKDNALISRRSAQRAWTTVVDSLNDELTALSRLIGYASLLTTMSPSVPWIQAMQVCMRGRALRLLREALEDGEHDFMASSSYEQIIYGLFQAACVECDLEAVQTHGMMLRRRFEAGQFTPQLLIQVLMYDGDFALLNNRRSIMDVDFWYPRVLAPIWKFTAGCFPRKTAAERDIHQSVAVPELREYIARTRDTSDVVEDKHLSHALLQADADKAFADSATKGLLDCAQLNHLYLDLVDEDQSRIIGVSVGNRLTQAALTAAVQYVKRRVGSESMINGIDHRDASSILMARMRSSLLKAFKLCTLSELFELAQPHLWLLFVGTQHDVKMLKSLHLVRKSWFANELAQQARLMNILQWEQMRALALEFMHADYLEPRGGSWYEKLLNMKCG